MAKVAAALALAGEDGATVSYCDGSLPGVRVHAADGGAGHPSCADKRAWRPLREVFGKSLDLPLQWRLVQLPAADLQAVARETGLRLDPGSPPATALVLGLASAAPADLAELAPGHDGRYRGLARNQAPACFQAASGDPWAAINAAAKGQISH